MKKREVESTRTLLGEQIFLSLSYRLRLNFTLKLLKYFKPNFVPELRNILGPQSFTVTFSSILNYQSRCSPRTFLLGSSQLLAYMRSYILMPHATYYTMWHIIFPFDTIKKILEALQFKITLQHNNPMPAAIYHPLFSCTRATFNVVDT